MVQRIISLVERLNSSDKTIFWHGPASPRTIDSLADKLGRRLPPSFCCFLELTGGGGIEGSEISGIEKGHVFSERCGGVWWDTLRCRQEFGLPARLVVIYFADDEICWCLDTDDASDDGECPVVSYDVFAQQTVRKLAEDFPSFLEEYIQLRL